MGYFRGTLLEEFIETQSRNILKDKVIISRNRKIEVDNNYADKFDVEVFSKKDDVPLLVIESKIYLDKPMYLTFVSRSKLLKYKYPNCIPIIVCWWNSIKGKGETLNRIFKEIDNLSIKIYEFSRETEFDEFRRDVQKIIK